MALNAEIIAVKDTILANAECERIYLFGSFAYGEPRADSDYDFYVVLPDNSDNPLLKSADISVAIHHQHYPTPVDVLALPKSRFDDRSQLWLTLEGKVVREGVLLYDRNGLNVGVV